MSRRKSNKITIKLSLNPWVFAQLVELAVLQNKEYDAYIEEVLYSHVVSPPPQPSQPKTQ